MTAKKKKTEKSSINVAKLLGVVGAVLGIILATLNIVYAVEKKTSEANSPPPLDLNVQYLSIREDGFENVAEHNDSIIDGFFSYPHIANALSDSGTFENRIGKILYLTLENPGTARIHDVKIVFDEITLSSIPTISSLNYEKSILSHAVTIDTITFTVDINNGVLFPLAITSGTDIGKNSSWLIVSKKVYLPKFIRFIDPVSKKEVQQPIRKMHNAMTFTSGLEIRG